ncbi:hypothetical protein MJO29_006397 [Puccinia striiformis f. sp. tritici]|nr:hypothetical protein MJO29_006397 [Puccinia striiformis f. sp. tritici]
MSHPTNTTNITSPFITNNPSNPLDHTNKTISDPSVMVSPELQSLLATYPGPPSSSTSTLDRSCPISPPIVSERTCNNNIPIDFKKTCDSNSKEFLPDNILESLNDTGCHGGHPKKANFSVNQDPIETSHLASNLPILITDPQNYNFTTGGTFILLQWYLKYNPKLTVSLILSDLKPLKEFGLMNFCFPREEVAKVDLDHKIRKLTIALSHKPPT